MKSFPAPDGPELPAKDTGRVPGLLHYADNSVMMTKKKTGRPERSRQPDTFRVNERAEEEYSICVGWNA